MPAPPGITITRNGAGRSVLAIVVGYLSTNIVTLIGTLLVLLGGFPGLGLKYSSYMWVIAGSQIAGGYVAAAVAREKEILHGAVLALVLDITLMAWFGMAIYFAPGASPFASAGKIILSIGAPVFGAYLRLRHHRKAAERKAAAEEAELEAFEKEAMRRTIDEQGS